MRSATPRVGSPAAVGCPTPSSRGQSPSEGLGVVTVDGHLGCQSARAQTVLSALCEVLELRHKRPRRALVPSPACGAHLGYPWEQSGDAGGGRLDCAGDSWACAVMSDETARCWGSGSSGQLGNGRSRSSVPAAPVLESGTPTSSPVTLSAVSSLSTGYLQSCVVRTTGEIRCSGYSQWGCSAMAR